MCWGVTIGPGDVEVMSFFMVEFQDHFIVSPFRSRYVLYGKPLFVLLEGVCVA